jgi:SAM-dependent methyltransferase
LDSAESGQFREQLADFWSKRSESGGPSTMEVRTEPEHVAWLDSLRPLLPPPPVDVLDVGTGRGFVALLMADLGQRVVGIDLAPGMLASARSHAAGSANPPEFRSGDATDPPFPPGSLDVLSNRQVFWTLLDPSRALRNWLALLRPGGMLFSIHLRKSRNPGESYSDDLRRALPRLRLDNTSDEEVSAADIRYADAVANLVRNVGFEDVRLTNLDPANRFEEELGTERRWLVLTGRRPNVVA